MTETPATSASSTARTLLAVTIGLAVGAATMFLVLRDPFGWGAHLGASAEADTEVASSELWTCGMHPDVIQAEGGVCPICQMDLVPLQTGEMDHGPMDHGSMDHGSMDHGSMDHGSMDHGSMDHGSMDHGSMDHGSMDHGSMDHGSMDHGAMDQVSPPPPPPAPQGATVRIDPTVIQNMNVRTAGVTRRDLSQPIRTVGYLDYDQQRMVTVTTKYSGWVEKVYVSYIGEAVKKGQPLFEVYSPELVQTEQELLSALDFARTMDDAPADARRRAEALVEAARVRLSYWDISDKQIRQLEESGEVFRTLTVVAPKSGLVMKRMAGLEGMAVRPGMEIFHLADISSLWLSVEIFEDQVIWVREGTPAEISMSYFPGRTFRGTIRLLEPEMSEETRTLKVRIEVPNPRRELRKGMFATVVFDPVRVADAVTVPSQAILRTGQRNVAVVALGDGQFAPREIVAGHEAQGFVEVIEGLSEGEEVVVSAQFLLDSESKLREAIQKMVAELGTAAAAAQASAESHAHHGH